MEDGLRAIHALGVGHLRPEQSPLVERDTTGVLHRARPGFGHEELVVLAKRILVAEAPLEEVEPLARDLEDLVGFEVLSE